jgi:ribosome-associated toxin RatA of RatAB toxin-antitoxin module
MVITCPHKEPAMHCLTSHQTAPYPRVDDTVELDISQCLSASLPIGARTAYELFCEVETIPVWVSLVNSVRVLDKNALGRPERVAFLAELDRATIGYTLHYSYDEHDLIVSWQTPHDTMTRISGRVQFQPLGKRACLIQYTLNLELPEALLPTWEEPFVNGHAASAVINDFRDHIDRTCRQ